MGLWNARLADPGGREPIWTLIHRYVGLVFAAWIFAVGATGAFLSYYQEIDVWLNPELFNAVDSPRNPDIEAMVSVVREAYPARYILHFERYFLELDETYPFALSEPMPSGPGGLDLADLPRTVSAAALEVFVDPRTQVIVGERPYWTWIKLIRQFHRDLLLERGGHSFLGPLGMVLCLACIAGAVLWWRASRRNLRRALTPRITRSLPQLARETHTVFGAYALIVIGWLAFTGVLMCYEGPLRKASNVLLQIEPKARPAMPSSVAHFPLNAARDIALAEYPDSDLVLMRFARSPAELLMFRLYPANEPVSIYTRQVYVHAGSGTIVGRFDPSNQPWTDSLFGVWLIWFHNGGMLGSVGAMLNLLAGLVLALLVPTGVYIWWRKRVARVRRAMKSQPSANDLSTTP